MLWKVILAFGLLVACVPDASPPTSTHPPAAEKLIFYDWLNDMPESVLEAFARETGIRVTYLTYESQEEAVANLTAGEVYDVAVVEDRYILQLSEGGLVTELDRSRLPNLKNISPDFRDLVHDPGNRYAVPYSWGTTGIVVRSDLVSPPVARWADLWNPRFAGKIGLWRGEPRDTLGLTLRSLGYSANSEDPTELEAALQRLLELRPHVIFLEDLDLGSSAPLLISGRITVAMGWALDVLEARRDNAAIAYVLPEEGALLWGDNFVIPASSTNRHAAEQFLNFVLRPDIAAQIVNQNYYATPNEAAFPLIAPEILGDPVIFPANEDLQNAEIILPLSPEGQQRYDDIWTRFLAATPASK
jgi:spermidine/putrescine transport system substrate-binding protein